MSILLGPLSETISCVSWRACARAGDHTAGAAGNALPVATAAMDFKKSRRFITTSRLPHSREFRKGHATIGACHGANGKVLDSQGCDAVRWRLMPIDMNILPLIQPRLRKNWASKCTWASCRSRLTRQSRHLPQNDYAASISD